MSRFNGASCECWHWLAVFCFVLGSETARAEILVATRLTTALREGTNVLAAQAFHRARENGDFQFNAGLAAARLDLTPPVIIAVTPAPGTVTALGEITVTFSEAVSGVDEEDLLINHVPARRVTGGGAVYSFTFDPPARGMVQVSLAATHRIADFGATPNPFDHTVGASRWQYTLVDGIPPVVVQVHPPPAARPQHLTQVEVLFNEPVTGLDAADLLIEGQPAASVSGILAGPYVFEFPPTAEGVAGIAWAENHGIRDLAEPANGFEGRTWEYFVDASAPTGQVVLTEFCASNLNGLKDEDGDAEDWIELHNAGATAVNLAGWSLTDDADFPGKWTFPELNLPPGQYVVVFASGKDRRAAGTGARLHTNFKLGGDGEYLGLFDANAPRRVSSALAPKYPTQRNDYSFGLSSGASWQYFRTPSPGAANGTSRIGAALPKVQFSAERAFRDAPVDLTLTNADADAVIRYTTDGSEPTEGTGAIYAGPVRIERSLIVRAAAFKTNRLPSKVATHSYVFPDQVIRQSANPAGFPTNWGSTKITAGDYAMDPRIVDAPAYAARVRAGLRSLPVISLVMPVRDWFSPEHGIYSNGQLEGTNWERAASAELIEPDGRDGFQVDCGVRVQGGTSLQPWKSYKLSLRLNFRSDYGPARLEHRLFSDTPVTSFDTLVLDAGLNYAWHYGGASSASEQRHRAKYVQDQFVSDLQNAAGTPSFHGRWVNLFINGLYWGIYGLHENPNAAFAADYFGGDETEYDVLKHTGSTVQDGNALAWQAMMTVARRGLADPANYAALAGLVDLPALADYLLINFYVGNTDWPHHNWYAIRRRAPGALWRFHSWDAEQVLKGVNDDRTVVVDVDSPAELYSLLRKNAEFRLLFADRAHRHFFNGGILSVHPQHVIPDPVHPQWNRPADFFFRRVAEIQSAIAAESARWGDNQRPAQPYTPDVEWKAELDWMRGTYFPQRSAIVLNRLSAAGLYPKVAAPTLSQHGGYAPAGFELTLRAPAGEIFLTLDGTDPRVPRSGALSASAVKYGGSALVLTQDVIVKARVRSGSEWSALMEAVFQVARLRVPLLPTEIMYHPPGGNAFEFLELQNFGRVALDLSGHVLEGIGFMFPPGSEIGPGQVVVLASSLNSAAFAGRYPAVPVSGYFAGSLANGGESLALRDPQGQTIWQFEFDDASGWPVAADGAGASLELAEPESDLSNPVTWRASTAAGGTPGVWRQPVNGPVRLNEVLAAPTALGALDFVEIHNSGATDVALAGWQLTDRSGARAFSLPADARVAAGGFAVVWCDGHTNAGSWHAPFALDRDGDDVFLHDTDGHRVDALSFGPQADGFSLGRDSGGAWRLSQPTVAADNVAAPTAATSSLALNEWLANALPGDDDWLELFNRNPAAPVALKGMYIAADDTLFRIGTHAFVTPGGFLRLRLAGKSGGSHVGIKLSAAGDTIQLLDATGAPVDRVDFGAMAQDASMGRLPDGEPGIVVLAAQTPGAPNSQDPLATDRDGDGLPDGWEQANGQDPRSASGDDGAKGDPDADGQTNLQEFLAGTLPNDADSHLRLAAVKVAPGAVELEWKAVPGRRYAIEFCGKLPSADWLELTNLPPAETAGTIRVPLDLSGASGIRFLRLGVSLR